MPLLRRFGDIPFRDKGVDWHGEIDKIVGRIPPLTPGYTLNLGFPWDAAHLLTEKYISSKKRIRQSASDRDSLLLALISGHEDKTVAVAACGHALTPQTAKRFFDDQFSQKQGITPEVWKLEVAVILHHVRSDTVPGADLEIVRKLLKLMAVPPEDFKQYFILALNTYSSKFSARSLYYLLVDAVLDVAFKNVAEHLRALELAGSWLNAWTVSKSGFDAFPAGSNQVALAHVLQQSFPNWLQWKLWRPDLQRLLAWQVKTPKRMLHLGAIVTLEGPDSTGTEKSTLREGFIARYRRDQPKYDDKIVSVGALRLQLMYETEQEVQTLLELLCEVMDAACRKGFVALDLLNDYCKGTIDQEKLMLVRQINEMDDHFVLEAAHHVCFSGNGLKNTVKIGTLLRGLASDHLKSFRTMLRDEVAIQVAGSLSSLREMSLIHLWERDSIQTGLDLLDLRDILQETQWLLPFLCKTERDILASLPRVGKMLLLEDLRMHATNHETASQAKDMVLGYMCDALNGTIVESGLDAAWNKLELLIEFWPTFLTTFQRDAALTMAVTALETGSTERDAMAFLSLGRECFSTIPDLSEPTVKELAALWRLFPSAPVHSWLGLSTLLTSLPWYLHLEAWQNVLKHWLSFPGALEMSIKVLSASEWFQGLHNLEEIFGSTEQQINYRGWHEHVIWAREVSPYIGVIKTFEDEAALSDALTCFMAGASVHIKTHLLGILTTLSTCVDDSSIWAIRRILSGLNANGNNAKVVSTSLSCICSAKNQSTITRLSALKEMNSLPIEDVALLDWLTIRHEPEDTKEAFRNVTKALGVEVDDESFLTGARIGLAFERLESKLKALVGVAQNLDDKRRAVAAVDRVGTSVLLGTINIDCSSTVDDALADLPSYLVDNVEEVSDATIKLHLPVTHLPILQRISMGLGEAQGMYVRLDLECLSFCIHIEEDGCKHHRPYSVDMADAPQVSKCDGAHYNRARYQLTRILYWHLRDGFEGIEKVYSLMVAAIDGLNKQCMVCGSVCAAALHRSTICVSKDCVETAKKMSVSVQLADVHQDPPVVNLLLAAAYSTAVVSKMDLITGCPMSDPSGLKSAIDSLPDIKGVQNNRFLTTSFSKPDRDMLAWLCNAYRGFLITVSSSVTDTLSFPPSDLSKNLNYRIPALPGVHQFLLANASPDLEAQFRSHYHTFGKSKVVFHGTTLDRLYPILVQGLRICSRNTYLQAHGASYGSGVYVTDDPSTAFAFGRSMAVMGFGNAMYKHDPFGSVKVILGCELAGDVPSATSTITVVTDPTRLIVRYVFLVPDSVAGSPPIRAHIEPAIASVFASLRAGMS